MRFNYQNQEKVNDLYVHDSDFDSDNSYRALALLRQKDY